MMLLSLKKRNYDLLVKCFIMRSEMVSFQTNTSVICPYVRARLWRGEEGGECERWGEVSLKV